MRWVSYGYLVIGFSIALGAFGHSFVGIQELLEPLGRGQLEAGTVRLILMVWYFAGGCMLCLGLLVMYLGLLHRQGRAPAGIAIGIGVFYVAVGVWVTTYMRDSFFLVFTIQGAMLLGLAAAHIRSQAH